MLIGVTNRSEHPQVFEDFDAQEVLLSVGNDTPLQTLNNWEMQSSSRSFKDDFFYQAIDGGLMSADSQHVYFLGIIDIFTEYNTKKAMEHVYKSVVQDRETISCVPPRQYADRFYQFMASVFTEE